MQTMTLLKCLINSTTFKLMEGVFKMRLEMKFDSWRMDECENNELSVRFDGISHMKTFIKRNRLH